MTEQAREALDFDFCRIALLQDGRQGDPEIQWAETVAVGDRHLDAAALAPGEHARFWSETPRNKSDPPQRSVVQIIRQVLVVHVGRAEKFEGTIGSATDADVAEFEKTDA